jgi:hypothetical protein
MNSAAATEVGLSTAAWWAARRLRYNLVLLVGGIASFLSLVVVGWLFAARLPCFEITVLSVAVSGILFLAGLGLANLCYYLGPLSESWLHPKNILGFRRLAFSLGTAFSLVLIFFPVAANLASAVIAPMSGGQCE